MQLHWYFLPSVAVFFLPSQENSWVHLTLFPACSNLGSWCAGRDAEVQCKSSLCSKGRWGRALLGMSQPVESSWQRMNWLQEVFSKHSAWFLDLCLVFRGYCHRGNFSRGAVYLALK